MARDIAFRGMVVQRDGKGRRRLYAAGVTADEYIPELRRPHPPRILSTADGRHFRATPARDVIVRMPYGIFRPIGFRTMQVLDGRMYVTAIPGLTGDGAIFEVRKPWSPRRAEFRQLSPRSLAVFETEIFRGALYAGTGDRDERLRRLPHGPARRRHPLRADRDRRRRPRADRDVRRLHAPVQGPPVRRLQRMVERGGRPDLRAHQDRPRAGAGRSWPDRRAGSGASSSPP